MLAIFRYLEAIAASPAPVLVSGESGTGKELIAAALHRLSGRSGELVAVNVAGLDDQMFSDTLFGHVRGSFTGAERSREGLIASAADGTLFLDEIGDLTTASQVKLLRLLQDGSYYPLGADSPKRSRARVVVATNVDVLEGVAKGSFRKDLYYRLRTHHVQLPPLRARGRPAAAGGELREEGGAHAQEAGAGGAAGAGAAARHLCLSRQRPRAGGNGLRCRGAPPGQRAVAGKLSRVDPGTGRPTRRRA
jgi:transcriptional regulator of acetoin/glycerol metabolism